jgi:group I intron endonuclease
MSYGYIYKTTNLLNGKIYVGQRKITADKRCGINTYLGSGLAIQKAIKKYGRENFSKENIEFCETKELLNEREIYWIKTLGAHRTKSGYNISEGGTGGFMNHLPPDHRQRCKDAKAKRTPEQKLATKLKFQATLAAQSDEQKTNRKLQNQLKRKGKPSWSKGKNLKELYSTEVFKERFCRPKTESHKLALSKSKTGKKLGPKKKKI